MQKTKSIFSVAILFMLALMVFTGCQVSPMAGPEPQPVEVESVEADDSRGTEFKFVTAYRRGVVQRLRDYEIAELLGNPGPEYDSYNYSKDGFTGSLPKDSFTVVKQRRVYGNVWEFTLDLCYKGIVTKYVPPAEEKVVTASREVTQRLKDYEIAGNLGNLGPSYESYYYNSGGFKGSIPKIGYTTLSSKNIYGNVWEFRLRLNYKGTVYKN